MFLNKLSYKIYVKTIKSILIFLLAVERPSNNIEPTLKPIDSSDFMIDPIANKRDNINKRIFINKM